MRHVEREGLGIMQKVVQLLPRKLRVKEFYEILDNWIINNVPRSKLPYSRSQGTSYFGIFKLDTNFDYNQLEESIKKAYPDNYCFYSNSKYLWFFICMNIYL